ncbi:S8 family serine peptidase [Halalkalibacter kiskunsagensis]|uniref:S8 family serine peptidase n=1 Tax=Halalkalibacter kiskunsagensis TaxID=1548599 RepID=A0ABV6K758_9BACI
MKKKWLRISTIIFLLIATIILINYLFSYGSVQETWENEFIGYEQIHSVVNGENQKIAIIDSGISEYQIGNLDKNINLIDGEEPYDVNGHGTMMFSLIKGSKSAVGICPMCEILSIKVMNTDESIKPNVISEAIEQAIDQNVSVISLSLGSYFENDVVKYSLDRAIKENIVIIASSGDYGTTEMLFPANMDKVISVGAINNQGEIWTETNAKDQVDINAPGVDVTVSGVGNEEFLSTGTSQSSAIIAGYVALMKEKDPTISIEEIKEILNDINDNKTDYRDFFLG